MIYKRGNIQRPGKNTAYPESNGAKDTELWLNKGVSYEGNVEKRNDLWVIKDGLKIPADAEDYTDFTKKMEKAEESFFPN